MPLASDERPYVETLFGQYSWSIRHNFELLLKPVDKNDFGGSPVATDAWYRLVWEQWGKFNIQDFV